MEIPCLLWKCISSKFCFCCMCELIDDWSNRLRLQKTSHVGTATTFAQEKTLPTCNVLSDWQIPHHFSPLQKVGKLRKHWENMEKLPTSSVSAGFHATDLMLKSKCLQILWDIPMTLFSPPITGQSNQDFLPGMI